MGGFECSTHRRFDGQRLDMIAATAHDKFAKADYARLADFGMRTARDGIRWHLIETSPGKFDFSSVAAQMDAAEQAGVQVIWDLFHYGYPDDIDIFADEFTLRLADLAAAFTDHHLRQTGRAPYVVPVNEISFYSWMGGEIGGFKPYGVDRGDELKRRLVRSAIAASRAVLSIAPEARIITTEPAVYVRARPGEEEYAVAAESYRRSQYQAFDMLSGRLEPELGGRPEYLDIIGINYYPHNQWFYPERDMITLGDPLYRPLHHLLGEVYQRYERPIFIAETGTEDDRRMQWFSYVAEECEQALRLGVDLQGICLYPVVDHPGWVDERHCRNGLWGYCDESGEREIYEPLAAAIRESRIAASVLECEAVLSR